MAARLRLPRDVPLDEKVAKVDELINKLGLSKVKGFGDGIYTWYLCIFPCIEGTNGSCRPAVFPSTSFCSVEFFNLMSAVDIGVLQ